MSEIINDTYKTISTISEGYYRSKGSKFYAFAYPVSDEEQIKQILTDIKKKYYDAHHHCYAYKIGKEDDKKFKMNDDGEPSSSAGKPIYGQILSSELTNILIIVVRYFGGIKLGIPGLILAYKTATADAINNNTIITKIMMSRATISCAYKDINIAMKVIKDESAHVIAQNYINNENIITIEIRNSKLDNLIDKVKSIFGLEIHL